MFEYNLQGRAPEGKGIIQWEGTPPGDVLYRIVNLDQLDSVAQARANELGEIVHAWTPSTSRGSPLRFYPPTKIKVIIEDRINFNPDAPPLGHIGFTASEDFPLRSGWRGCPLGRATTKEGAVKDLLQRANVESGTNYKIDDLEIVDKSEGY